MHVKLERTLREMLADRGYKSVDVLPEEDDERGCKWATCSGPGLVNLVVFSSTDDKVRVEHVRAYIDCLDSLANYSGLLVHEGDITPSALTLLTSGKIQTFHKSYLWNNITRHELYFPHTLLSEDEAQKLISSLKTTKDKLPRISCADPVVKYFGWGVGAVVKIQRKLGGMQITQPYWRVVTEVSQ